MEPIEPRNNQVGVRELRQNLSVYLERVQNGESLRVTDRGRVVALLSPLASDATALEAVIAAGRATPAAGSLTDLGPPAGKPSRVLSKLLAQMRDEERY
jgi:prevent-host-death family protein